MLANTDVRSMNQCVLNIKSMLEALIRYSNRDVLKKTSEDSNILAERHIATETKAYFPRASKWVTDERMTAGVLSSPAPQSGMHITFLFTPELLHNLRKSNAVGF